MCSSDLGDHGITLEEYTPFGVVGAVTPSTHSIPTLSGNIVNICAAGNAVVFNPHPSAARCAAVAIRAYNEAIFRETGIENIATIISKPTMESFAAMCKHEAVRLLLQYGGRVDVPNVMGVTPLMVAAGLGMEPAPRFNPEAAGVQDRSVATLNAARNEQASLDAERQRADADGLTRIDDARAALASAQSDVAKARADLTRVDVRVARQRTQQIVAPLDGTVLRVVARQSGEQLKAGAPLAVLEIGRAHV